jgi:hypothetical protein
VLVYLGFRWKLFCFKADGARLFGLLKPKVAAGDGLYEGGAVKTLNAVNF